MNAEWNLKRDSIEYICFFKNLKLKWVNFFLNEWKMKYKERQYTDICTILLKINEKWNSKWGRTLSDR